MAAEGTTVESFRVFNNVSRVGVDWRLFGTSMEWPAVVTMVVVLIVFAALSGVWLLIGGVAGTALFGLFVLVGLACEVMAYVWIMRIKALADRPARIRETTLVKLAYQGVAEPVITNFATPDRSEIDAESFTRDSMIITNY